MDLMLNFSNVYDEPTNKIKFIDCKDISGTNMYCTESAKNEIKKKLKNYSPRGIHFIDGGGHYSGGQIPARIVRITGRYT